MASPRTCPHCFAVIPIDKDFSFDEELNLICGYCGEIVYRTVKQTGEETETDPVQNNLLLRKPGSLDAK